MYCMKKFFAAIAAFVSSAAVLSSLPACASPQVLFTVSEDGTHYIVSGVSGYKSGLKDYVIPQEFDDGTHGILPVAEIGDEAFMNCTRLESIVIPRSVETIGIRAFMCTRLNELEIPQSVQEIGFAAFAFNSMFYEVTIPSSVTQIGAYAFAYCTNLRSIDIDANIKVLEEGVVQGWVTSSGSEVYSSTLLTQISLPAGLEKIHEKAFSDNFLTDIFFDGTRAEWEAVELFRREQRPVEDGEEGQTETVEVLFSAEEKIDFYTIEGLTIHCSDADLVYSGGKINATPVG